jgi:hypothetical protein
MQASHKENAPGTLQKHTQMEMSVVISRGQIPAYDNACQSYELVVLI